MLVARVFGSAARASRLMSASAGLQMRARPMSTINFDMVDTKKAEMEEATLQMMRLFWHIPDDKPPLRWAVKMESLLDWYRGFYEKNKDEKAEQLAELYDAANTMYSTLHAYQAVYLLGMQISSTGNELLRESGVLGDVNEETDSQLMDEVHGIYDAIQKLVMSLPKRSELRRKCKAELAWAYSPVKMYTYMPRASFQMGVINQNAIMFPDERNNQ